MYPYFIGVVLPAVYFVGLPQMTYQMLLSKVYLSESYRPDYVQYLCPVTQLVDHWKFRRDDLG